MTSRATGWLLSARLSSRPRAPHLSQVLLRFRSCQLPVHDLLGHAFVRLGYAHDYPPYLLFSAWVSAAPHQGALGPFCQDLRHSTFAVMRRRRPLALDGKDARRWLASRPVGLFGFRGETEALVEPLGRLGVRTPRPPGGVGRPPIGRT